MPPSGQPGASRESGPGRGSTPRRPAAARGPRRWGESLAASVHFFGSFLRRPARVGSLVPSSRTLARSMVEDGVLERARVVELGPGTGSFTSVILERLAPDALLVAVELDEGHARRLQKRYPAARIFHGSAEHLPRFLRRTGVAEVDCVISGLPWANMSRELQDRILEPVISVLTPHGEFATFSYVHARWIPGAVRFRSRLSRYFGQVTSSQIVWRNLPPAVVYRCRQPRAPAGRSSRTAP